MFVVFEDAGKFLTGRVLSRAETSLQVELESGKRMKLKTAQSLLEFEQPEPMQLLEEANDLCRSMDVNLVWECAPEEEFTFVSIAQEYFNAKPSSVEQAAALVCLFNAPHYFRRMGKGKFKKADASVVRQALAAIEKKKAIQDQIQAWAVALGRGECPPNVREQLYKILFKPDKNAPEYKAVVEASWTTKTAPIELLKRVGAIDSAYQFHWQRFMFEHFPKGDAFPALQADTVAQDLPVANVQAFSIDDSSTTEIDDALSVQGLGTGKVILGIHIAAPGLSICAQDAIDKVARERLSTVYMPGHKITMLPDHVVQQYTLLQGRTCPALSLYVHIDEVSLEIVDTETRLELVPIDANLRHDQLDAVVTEESLTRADFWSKTPGIKPYYGHEQLSFLYRLASRLKSQREVVRGKPETFNRPDYNFHVQSTSKPLQGDEPVDITLRRRGAPLDLIVAEAMILANSTWGQWMAQLGVPAIYRSQASLAPGIKVRMGTKALPHAGIGVKCYAWSTSPLRRYTDLVNQWQILACVRYGKTAALAAPFKSKDVELFAVISSFDAAYAAYSGFQNNMERYWTLQYIQQRAMTELTGVVFKEGLVRADNIPLVLNVTGVQQLQRGARVRVKLGTLDMLTLEISASLLEVLEPDGTVADPLVQEGVEPEDDLDAGPISIAMDIADAGAACDAVTGSGGNAGADKSSHTSDNLQP